MRGGLRRVLGFGEKCSQAALEKLMRDQKRQYRESVEALEDFTTPYEVRIEQGRPPTLWASST